MCRQLWWWQLVLWKHSACFHFHSSAMQESTRSSGQRLWGNVAFTVRLLSRPPWGRTLEDLSLARKIRLLVYPRLIRSIEAKCFILEYDHDTCLFDALYHTLKTTHCFQLLPTFSHFKSSTHIDASLSCLLFSCAVYFAVDIIVLSFKVALHVHANLNYCH